MCTYLTVHTELAGSAKGPNGPWFTVDRAAVYFDHPVHAQAGHTLNIDLPAPGFGPAARLALELTAPAARALATAITDALAAAPESLVAG
jgi:hypothetical protein